MGQVLPARQVALGAGLPISTPAYTINKVCGSSLKAVMLAANSIRVGEYSCIVAGGMESMTNAPKLVLDAKRGESVPPEKLINSMIHDGLWDIYNDVHMGITGEIVADEFDLDRNQIDDFSLASHLKAKDAWDNGWFGDETFSVTGVTRDGEEFPFEMDEGINPNCTLESLSDMKPAFKEDGLVTAGNASQLSDGSSAILVAEAGFAKEMGWPILAKIVDYATSGLEPERVMAAPIPCIETLLEQNSLTVDDVDVFEHNEAFASASCAVAKGVGISHEKLNLHGGAVALGHPIGASGSRCLLTMIHAMRRTNASKGIVSLCLGGGNAVGMLVQID